MRFLLVGAVAASSSCGMESEWVCHDNAMRFLVRSSDDPVPDDEKPSPLLRKQIIFIRHAYSDTDETKNGKGTAAARGMGISDPLLSALGETQAKELAQWIEYGGNPKTTFKDRENVVDESITPTYDEHVQAILAGKEGGGSRDVLIAVSTLKRAQATAWLALQLRLKTFTLQKLFLFSSLRDWKGIGLENSVSLKAGERPSFKQGDNRALQPNWFDATFNRGTTEGWGNLMKAFCKILATRSETTVIAVGHAHWLREMIKLVIQAMDPEEEQADGLLLILSKQKLLHTGVVSFELWVGSEGECEIQDSETVQLVYGNIEKDENAETESDKELEEQ